MLAMLLRVKEASCGRYPQGLGTSLDLKAGILARAGGIEAKVRLCHRRYPNQTSAKSFVVLTTTTSTIEPPRASLRKYPAMSATILHLSNHMSRTGIPSRDRRRVQSTWPA